MAADNTKRLLELKKEIEQTKLDKAGTEGAIAQNTNRLRDEFSVRSVDQGRKKLETLREKKAELVEKIDAIVEKLEANYSW